MKALLFLGLYVGMDTKAGVALKAWVNVKALLYLGLYMKAGVKALRYLGRV